MTRILLVDDHPLFLDGVRAALTGAGDLEVVGEAPDVAEAVARAAELLPDVVLMDLNLPDASGVEATSRILANRPIPARQRRCIARTQSVTRSARPELLIQNTRPRQ